MKNWKKDWHDPATLSPQTNTRPYNPNKREETIRDGVI